MAQLSEYAHRCGKDTASAIDLALAEYLAWARSEFHEAVEGIQEGYDDLKAGRIEVRRGDVRGTAREAWPSTVA
ncbi:MAG: hypothetical protein JOZ83_02735 [Silvibacterium sp.]|nr:hypothetical protein [Silvibacterium sp.]